MDLKCRRGTTWKIVILAIESSMRAVEDLRNRAEHQREKVEDLREELAASKRNGKTDEALQGKFDANRSLYYSMMERFQAEMASVSLTTSPLRIIDKATPPVRPYKPNIMLNLALRIAIPAGVFILLATLLFAFGSKKNDAPPPLPR
ncbi:hypothetical protein [Cerasicoccus maritimus]|uniref:hypothetical protein n=1 Tax=Cerasicoccus maritimus TaxID=490089 RepID=UPI0028524F85|nr:hypothetical protein [Cerasicoccus maritimus]